MREVSKCGKPTVLGEFGWYGGGKLKIQAGHPTATEQQQARWCQQAVESTAGWCCGWMNWGFHDHPGATDVSQLTGLLTVEGKVKAWGARFQDLARYFGQHPLPAAQPVSRPSLDWDLCAISCSAEQEFMKKYFQAYKGDPGK